VLTPIRSWHAELGWVAGAPAADVRLTAEGERLVRVETGVPRAEGDTRFRGLLLPGLVDAHSHAFHRALRGRTHAGGGDFWTWREAMYAVADALDPDRLRAVAVAAYAEMALAGVTAVGEFHYVHHRPGGRPYADPNAMGLALVDAAAEAGVRITLLDTCYLRGGVDGRPLDARQRRFGDGSAGAWAERVAALGDGGTGWRPGAAVHSVRAVEPAAMAEVAAFAAAHPMPLHLHLSEQPAENEDCLAATGRTPAALAADCDVLGPSTTAVHATHLTAADVDLLGATGTAVCLCPTTERDLADGIGPAADLVAAGSPLCLGSDSHAVVDLFEEARAVELDERLRTGRRGHHDPAALLAAATASGAASLGWDAGELAPGRLADFCVVDLSSPRLAGADPAQVVFAATAADVTDVVQGGEPVVRDRQHVRVADVGAAIRAAVAALPVP
jgi:formiminoglutamate deiminase